MVIIRTCAVVLAAVLISLSFKRGAAPERILALVLFVAAIFEINAAFSAQILGLVFDLITLGAIGAVALKANRVYPIWVGAVGISKLIASLWSADWMGPPLVAQQAMFLISVWAQLVILAIGIWCHSARVGRRGVVFPEWC